MKKRDFLKNGVAAMALGSPVTQLCAQSYPKPQSVKRPNLLLITADDIDWSCLGFMTGQKGITPNLDRLAARSHRFRQMRTSSPICMPSRQAFMSGLKPHRNGGNGFFSMNDGTPTIASRLSEAGWFAGATHKIKHMRPASSFPWSFKVEGIDRHPDLHARGLDLIIEEARAQYKPWFANCNINDPHRPFYNSAEAIQMDHGQTGAYKVENEFTADDVTVPANLEDLPQIREEIARYWNSCQRFDKAVGNILQVLEESGDAENTVIMFISDHGMPMPFAKATCYDHGVRVPALVCYPDMEQPQDFDQMAINLDFHPTALELMGVDPTPDIDGQSLVPLMTGAAHHHRDMVMTHVDYVSSGYAYPMRGLQDERYALLFTPWANSNLKLKIESMWGLTWPAMLDAARTDKRIEVRVGQYLNGISLAFYDLKKDPGQRVNRIHDQAYANQVATMKARMLQEMEASHDPQLDNFRLLLAGKTPTVEQNPSSHRMAGFPD